jgi:hypothetical protein
MVLGGIMTVSDVMPKGFTAISLRKMFYLGS